jgi:heme-degrading monooxygenase HmoA
VILVAWEFRARPGREAEFEEHYAPSGAWGRLFARSPAYRGTTLARDANEGHRYLLTDTWTDRAAFDDFRAAHAGEYEALDRRGEALTDDERCLGWFAVVESAS